MGFFPNNRTHQTAEEKDRRGKRIPRILDIINIFFPLEGKYYEKLEISVAEGVKTKTNNNFFIMHTQTDKM